MSRLSTRSRWSQEGTHAQKIQASLLKTLAAERRIFDALHGQAHAGSAHFKHLASLLPHQTILTVLKFLGFGQSSMEVFERFLSAKLNIGRAVGGAPNRVLPRARSVPEGHALELVCTEAIMFLLERAVHKNSGSIMYKLKDVCYFVGNNEQYLQYEKEVALFADAMGLQVKLENTQSIGFLDLGTGIQTDKVITYAQRAKTQLQACKSILDWVRLWNKAIGDHAVHLFGPLDYLFGKEHPEDVNKSYKAIYNIIFDGGSLTAHVTQLLVAHLTPGAIDSSFPIEELIHLSQVYGGLGVKNPFITLSLLAPLMQDTDAHADLIQYFEAEDLYYKNAENNYALLGADAYVRKLESIFDNDKTRIEAALGLRRDLTVFMSKEELIAHREKIAYPNLWIPQGSVYMYGVLPSRARVYSIMLGRLIEDMRYSRKIRDEVERLQHRGEMKS